MNRHNVSTDETDIDYHWVGNLTDTSATVKIVPKYKADLLKNIKVQFNEVNYNVPLINNTYTLHLTELVPEKKNLIKYEGGSKEISFDTPNSDSFTFAAVSCQHTLSSSDVY